jgi:hypothetical protein
LFDNHIQADVAVKGTSFVDDGQSALPDVGNTGEGEFVAQARFVNRFEKAGSEGSVDLDRAPDHAAS